MLSAASTPTKGKGIALGRCRHYLRRGDTRALPEARRQRRPGPMQSLFEILMLILGVARFFIFAHFIMSWLIQFQVLNIRQPFVSQVWYGLNRMLEPLYAPIRRVLPNMGGVDLSPIVALIAIYALEIILRNNIGLFV
jgi:YggT family protein